MRIEYVAVMCTLRRYMHDLPLITTIAIAFSAAWVLGLITQHLRLSPIVGYLLAGVLIGPHTPGLVADIHIAQQLAELGVILLMFGVGLHFQLSELLAVRKVAVPGAVVQSIVATALGTAVALGSGWPVKSGLVLGMAMSVASTVVLIRVLTDYHLLESHKGHIAVGWLIVEDILTVLVLVLIPAMGASGNHPGGRALWLTLLIAIVKLGALVAILLLAGSRVIPWVMVRVARLRSRELFTLTVMVMAIAIAAASSYVFGASMALGAFLAGMVVGQSPVSQQAAADALPLRDAFAVLFFTSVGMVFDPSFLIHDPILLLAGLGVVLIGKPIAAMLVIALIGYPARTGITVALGLAQIGEFSFILSQVGRDAGLMNERGHSLLVATAIVSITLNPLLFRAIEPIERALRRSPRLWDLLNSRAGKREQYINEQATQALESGTSALAVVLGYGPVGRTVDGLLRARNVETVVVDLNIDTVESLTKAGRAAIFGDAYNVEVMHSAMARATHLLITLPHSANRNPLIATAKLINPEIKVFVRAHYLSERAELEQAGADQACYEEMEAAVALSRLVLTEQGADEQTVRREVLKIRQRFSTIARH